jgi:hypothetical protein
MRERKQNKLPERYSKNFLAKMDGRIELARELKAAFEEVTNDLGGIDTLSHMNRSLCERFVFLEAVLRGLELQMAEEGTKQSKVDAGQLLSRWIQGLNSLTGLARTLGLERRARKVDDLRSYVASKSRRASE